MAELKNLSQQQTLNALHRAHTLILVALQGHVQEEEEERRKTLEYRAKTMILAEKAINFKTFRRHRRPLQWPDWLQEAGMEGIVSRLCNHWWQFQQEERTLREEMLPRLRVPVATEEGQVLTLDSWVSWLREVEEAFKWRRAETASHRRGRSSGGSRGGIRSIHGNCQWLCHTRSTTASNPGGNWQERHRRERQKS